MYQKLYTNLLLYIKYISLLITLFIYIYIYTLYIHLDDNSSPSLSLNCVFKINHNSPYTLTFDNNYVSKYLYYINYIFIIIFLFRDSKSSPNSTVHNSYSHLAHRYTSFALQIPYVAFWWPSPSSSSMS